MGTFVECSLHREWKEAQISKSCGCHVGHEEQVGSTTDPRQSANVGRCQSDNRVRKNKESIEFSVLHHY